MNMSQRPAAESSATAASSAPAAKAAAKSKVVFNPYAKKKSTTSASAPAPATGNNRTKSVHTNITASNPYSKFKHSQQQTQQQPQRRVPPPPVNVSTTFSQTFGDADPDAHFCEEERAQHVAFGETLASTTNSSNDESISNSTNDIILRDHHTMLQPHILHISTRQRENPMIAHIRNVPYQYSTMVPDYIFAPTQCALFLSL